MFDPIKFQNTHSTGQGVDYAVHMYVKKKINLYTFHNYNYSIIMLYMYNVVLGVYACTCVYTKTPARYPGTCTHLLLTFNFCYFEKVSQF